jgi:hypothetical protein
VFWLERGLSSGLPSPSPDLGSGSPLAWTLFLAIDAVSEDPASDPCDGDAETRHGRVLFQAVTLGPLPCVRRNQEALLNGSPLCL